MKIIIDTNVLMSGIFWSGPPAKILQAWQNRQIDFVLSPDILQEYLRVSDVLAQKYPGVDVDDIIEILVKRSKIYDIKSLSTPVSRDPNDDMFIACAIATKVKIIVSGDLDLLQVNGYQSIKIVKPKQFVDNYLTPR